MVLFDYAVLLHLNAHSQGRFVLILSGPIPKQGHGLRKWRAFGPQPHPAHIGTPSFSGHLRALWLREMKQQQISTPYEHGSSPPQSGRGSTSVASAAC